MKKTVSGLFLLAMMIVATGCSGGGGSTSPLSTPDPFTFTGQTGVLLNTVIESNSITVSGINTPAAISVTGGEYSVNNGAYTQSAGSVVNGDAVKVRQASSGNVSTTTTATLTIGGVSGSFSVTTASRPTQAILKLATSGTNATIEAMDVTVQLPAGVTHISTASSGVAVGSILVSNATTTPGMVRIALAAVPGFGIGEFCTMTCGIEPGTAAPGATDFSITNFQAIYQNNILIGLTPERTVVIH